MTRPTPLLSAIALILAAALPAGADENIDHYAAKSAPTFAAAVENFNTYNAKVADLLARDTLSTAELEEIHEYTYTLETALATINETLGSLPVTLEQLHKASEAHDTDTVRSAGEAYLKGALPLAE